MMHFRWLSTLTVLLAFTSQLLAQNNLAVGYASPGTVPDFLNVCGDADDVVVSISLDGLDPDPRTNIVSTLNLFPGVEIVNFNAALSSAGVVPISLVDPTKPIFQIPDLSPAGTTSVDIAFSIRADCSIPDTIAINNSVVIFDTWDNNYDMGGSSFIESDPTQEYRDAFAVPFFTTSVVNNVTASAVGDCFTRDILVTNSGLDGFVDSLLYENLTGSGITVNSIMVNGVPLTITKTVVGTDTLITGMMDMTHFPQNTIGGGASNGDGFIDPNETATITESICVLNCDDSRNSAYSFSWGCYNEVCGVVNTTDFVAIGQGAANVSIDNTGSIPDVNAGYCTSGNTSLTVSNNGVELDPGFGRMVDIETGIGLGNAFALTDNKYTITSLTIAGVVISPIMTPVSLDNNPLFATDPDGPGGLEDLDGDGFFDDMGIGESYEMTAYYDFDCVGADTLDAANECVNEYTTFFSGRSIYYDACGDFNPILRSSFFRPTNNNSDIQNSAQPDAYLVTDTFYISHFEERSILNFDKDCGGNEEFYLKIALPTGVTPAFSTITLRRNGATIPFIINSTSIVNDTAYVNFDGTTPFLTGKYDLRMGFTADCTAEIGPSTFPIEFGYSCPSCTCTHVWYCGEIDGPQLHTTDPPCPPLKCIEGLQTTSFEVERTTFGYTDNTYTVPINPATANEKVAISCDSIQMRLMNIVGELPLTDSIGVTITYNNVDGTYSTDETFLFDNAQVRINNGGVDYFCTLTPADLTVTSIDTLKKLDFDLSSCLTTNGITTLDPLDEIEFIGNFSLNPDGPYPTQFRTVPNLRGYAHATLGGDEFACDNYGEVFTIAKNQTVFAAPGSSDFPSGCDEAMLDYRLITVNNGFTDWFGNEFRQAVSIDSIVFTFDTTLLSVFDQFIPEVSIPGHPTHGSDFYPVNGFASSTNGVYVAYFDTLQTVPALNNVQSYSFNFRIRALPSCKALQGSENGTNLYGFNTELYWQDRFYATDIGDQSCSTLEQDSSYTNLTYTDPPTFTITPLSAPNINVVADTAEWVVQMCNTSFDSDSYLTWLSVVDTAGAIQIISVDDISLPATPVSLPVNAFNSTDYYVMSDGLLRSSPTNTVDQTCNTYHIKGLVQKCGNHTLQLESGWNCGPYADPAWTPLDYAPCDVLASQISFTTLDPFVDANVVEQPGATFPELCDTITIGILVRNTDLGSTYNLESNIILPLQGATLVPGSVEVAYPSSGTYSPALADPTFTGTTTQGNVYNYPDFSMLNSYLDANGLAGFNPTNPTDSNEMIIRYQFVTDCDYISGSLNYFNFVGEKSCVEPTNLEAGETLPIFLNGTTGAGTVLYDLSIMNGTGFLSGGSGTIDACATNLTNVTTGPTDQIVLHLPAGLTYDAGTSVASIPATWTVSEPTISTVAGVTMLTWDLPGGLNLNDQACMSFGVTAPVYDCSVDSLDVFFATTNGNSLLCTQSGVNCNTQTISSSNNGDTAIPVLQDNLAFDVTSMTSTCQPTSSEEVTIVGNIVNSSPTITLPAVNVDIYFDLNVNNIIDGPDVLVSSFNDANPLAPASSLPFTMNFSAGENALCNLIAQIDTTGYGGCGNALFVLETPKLQNAGVDTTFCVAPAGGVTGMLGGAGCDAMTGYTFNWTAIAPASLTDLDNPAIANPNLTINAPITLTDTYQYVLETARPNCGMSTDTISVTFQSGAAITAFAMPDTVGCSGSTTTSLIASGGVTYEWYDAASTLVGTGDTVMVTPTMTTTYTVQATDASGCVTTSQVAVTYQSAGGGGAITAFAQPDTVGCGGAAATSLIASGGLIYDWYDAASTLIGSGDTLVVTPTATTTYTVEATDASNCVSTSQVTVTYLGNPAFMATATPDTLGCGAATASALVGSGGTSYEWYDAANTLLGTGDTLMVTPASTTTYTMVGTDPTGCSAPVDVTVVVTGGITVFVGASPDTLDCTTNITTLTASGATTYDWFEGAAPIASGASVTVGPTATTTYTVVGSDGGLCTDTSNITVTVLTGGGAGLISATASQSLVCSGDPVTLTGGPGSFLNWFDTNTGTMVGNGTSISVTPTVPTNYLLVSNDDPSCPDSTYVLVDINPGPGITFSSGTVNSCSGDAIPITVSVTDSITSYVITGTGTFFSDMLSTNNSLTFVALYGGVDTYLDVALENANGCTTVERIDIVGCGTCLDEMITGKVSLNTTCGNSDGIATVVVFGNPADYQYNWAPAGGQIIPPGNRIEGLGAGMYSVTVTDLNNLACTESEVFAISSSDGPVATFFPTAADCATANGTASLTPSAFIYTWPDGMMIDFRDDLATGSYMVSYIDPADPACISMIEVVIPENNTLEADVTLDALSHCGVSDGIATINVTGGSGTYGFSWPSGTATQDSLAAGTNRVTITDNGPSACELPFIFVMIDSVPPATVTIDTVYDISCPGFSDGGVEFSINFDAGFVGPADTIITNSFNTFVNGTLVPGAYCIEIRDAAGCVAGGDCFTIETPEEINMVFNLFPACPGPDSLNIDVMISGGTPPFTVNWSDLPGTTNVEDRYSLADGIYYIEVTDANGCVTPFDSIVVSPCPVDPGCNIGLSVANDTIMESVASCDAMTTFCIQEDPFVLSTYAIFDNGQSYTAGLDPCDFVMSQGYDYATLIGAGNLGPYRVNSWSVDSNTYSGDFDDLDALMDSLNTWNPMGNWTYSTSPMFIYGGNNIFDYGDLVIEALSLGSISTFPYTALMTPGGFGIQIDTGYHELIVLDTLTGCADTLYALINCEPLGDVYDTIFIDEAITYCIDTSLLSIGAVSTMTNVCEPGTNVDFTIDPTTYCVTYEGLTIGIDIACIEFCDMSNVCDTIDFYINVIPEFILEPEWFVDSVFVFETDELCIDTTELPGNVVSINNFCWPSSGTDVEFFINDLTYCVEYTGLEIGKDTACIEICDDLGYCDTTFMCIYVPIYTDPPVAVDDYDTTFINVPVVTTIKPNDTLFGGIDSISLITEPLYGEAILNPDCTVTYNPGDEFCARTDHFDYLVCTPTGCDTATIHIYIECTDIVIFTAVSPNRDGINDAFYIAGIEDFPDSRLCLYNRWGNKIYEKIGYQNDWRGTWNESKDLPDGTYFYMLELNDEDQRKFSGYFEIFR